MEKIVQLYTVFHVVGPYLWLIVPLVFVDIGLKGWGMWRAARMRKPVWFIVLLLVNSLGIVPALFLLFTKKEYTRHAFLEKNAVTS